DAPGRKSPDSLEQLGLVEGGDLGNIHDASPLQIGFASTKQNITRSVGAPQVGSDGCDNDRTNVGAVGDVVLDHNAWPPIAWLGADWRSHVDPENVALPNVHVYSDSRRRLSSAPARNSVSSAVSGLAQARFIRRTKFSDCCRSRNSLTARANNRLRGMRI